MPGESHLPVLAGADHSLQSFDQQDTSFTTRRASPHRRCSRALCAGLCCALQPCAGVLRRCGWLPDAPHHGDDDDAVGAAEWEPDINDYEVLRLDEMEPAAPAPSTAVPGTTTATTTLSSGRGYAPPRPRPQQLHTPPPPETPDAHLHGAATDGLVRGVNAPSTSSLVDTEPSSTLSSAHHRAAGGDRWVMQRGVLVKVGADGTRTLETFAPMNSRTRGRPSPRRMRADGTGPESSTSRRSAAAAAVAEELDSLRQPISRLSELTAILERCCRHLPLRIEVAPDHAAVAQTNDGALPFTLQILGPLQKPGGSHTPCAEALTVVEDVLLDDCLEENLRLSCLHVCDVTLIQNMDGTSPTDVMDSAGLGSNAFLDMLLSPTGGAPYERRPAPQATSLHRQNAASSGGGRTPQPEDGGEEDEDDAADVDRDKAADSSHTAGPLQQVSDVRREVESRLLVLLTNLLESRARDISTLRFTRCVFSPLSIGDFLAPSLPYVRRLLFEQCPFSNAHLDAVLQTAHLLTQRAGTSHVALGALQELQLCGALSPDAIQEVLRFFAEEVPFKGVPCLRTVRLPFSLARAAREHPFAMAHPTVKIEICA